MQKNNVSNMSNLFENEIFVHKTPEEFNNLCISIFRFQYENNLVYKEYVDKTNSNINDIKNIEDIPFLPIEFFKTHRIIHKDCKESITFLSSGTTNINRSKHFVASEALYRKSFVKAFEQFYGKVEDYCFLALLPGYIERQGSSLIYMVQELMRISDKPDNGFYLNDFEALKASIEKLENKRQKYILIGVSHALLDFAEAHKIALNHGIVIETGGMKGRRKELLKEELHNFLKSAFQISEIHSEYGMTELLSQAYSKGKGLFSSPHWMKILIRDSYDPFSYLGTGKSGGINVIDLANIYSCSFIETKDLGKIHHNGQFEIIGRFDNSDIRGCNLLL